MKPENRLETFIRTGGLGAVRVGVPYSVVLATLGPTDEYIEDADPVYRYGDLEVYVDGSTGLVWMIQLEPFQGKVQLVPALELGAHIDVPVERRRFEDFLAARHIDYRAGEFHVPGQEELLISDSGVRVLFLDDGCVSSIAVVGSIPEHLRA
jgi:hypothetical protein